MSLSRQPLPWAHCWGCTQGTCCFCRRDFIWRPPPGTAGALAVPPSFWEAVAYCFWGDNRRARLSMSDASCMPLGDPGNVPSSLGQHILDQPFQFMPPVQPKRGHQPSSSAAGGNTWLPPNISDVLRETLCSREPRTQAKKSIFSIVPTPVEVHLHPHTSFLAFNHVGCLLLLLPQERACRRKAGISFPNWEELLVLCINHKYASLGITSQERQI